MGKKLTVEEQGMVVGLAKALAKASYKPVRSNASGIASGLVRLRKDELTVADIDSVLGRYGCAGQVARDVLGKQGVVLPTVEENGNFNLALPVKEEEARPRSGDAATRERDGQAPEHHTSARHPGDGLGMMAAEEADAVEPNRREHRDHDDEIEGVASKEAPASDTAKSEPDADLTTSERPRGRRKRFREGKGAGAAEKAPSAAARHMRAHDSDANVEQGEAHVSESVAPTKLEDQGGRARAVTPSSSRDAAGAARPHAAKGAERPASPRGRNADGRPADVRPAAQGPTPASGAAVNGAPQSGVSGFLSRLLSFGRKADTEKGPETAPTPQREPVGNNARSASRTPAQAATDKPAPAKSAPTKPAPKADAPAKPAPAKPQPKADAHAKPAKPAPKGGKAVTTSPRRLLKSGPRTLAEVQREPRHTPEATEVRTKILGLDPRLWLNGWLLSFPEAYALYEPQLKAIDAALAGSLTLGDGTLTCRELSYQVFGDEKFLEQDGDGRKLLERMGLRDIVRHRPQPRLGMLHHVPRKRERMRLVVTENLDPWLDIRELMYADGRRLILGEPVDGVIFGNGYLVDDARRLPEFLDSLACDEAEILYWGDIDRAGLQIFDKLKRVAEGRFELRPFVAAYAKMARRARERFPEPLDNELSAQEGVPFEGLDAFCEELPEDVRDYVHAVIAGKRLIPQEILTKADL